MGLFFMDKLETLYELDKTWLVSQDAKGRKSIKLLTLVIQKLRQYGRN